MNELITSIGNIKIKFSAHPNGIHFDSPYDSLLFPNLQAEEAEEILRNNYAFVYSHYKAIAKDQVNEVALQQACFKLVVFYFYMYALWKAYYENHKDRDLNFIPSDFDHPYTFDKVCEFFRRYYPETYAEKSAAMLGMNIRALKAYEQERQDFYNLW